MNMLFLVLIACLPKPTAPPVTEAMHQNELALSRETGNQKRGGSRIEVGQILGQLGLIALAFEDVTSAEQYVRQSIVILDEINPLEACRSHGFLGRVRAEQGQLAEARSHLDQAVAEMGAANKMTQSEALCNQDRVEYLAGDFDAANEALQAAEHLAKLLHEGSAFDLRKTISSVKTLNSK